ncbi:hypothetical protein UFOVP59_70 [uncultured Caudovirales phage]|uniref:Portal protein n=1 Tax=uncultured Caudovirales phage TaxID=2100421 RepID=A0A6J7WVH5_9CAUD|nr:hypothetical protein UFOVP59_70 [uncultured Caudovirales phage]CAB5220838.1 hypothetical protein UFOVP246_45 [uncultured Caudovirales phage]
MNKLSEAASKIELGVSGQNTYSGLPFADEFLTELRGNKAIQKYREMRDNNATIGAVMYAVEQTLRDVEIKVVAADDSQEAADAVVFMKSILDDMDHSLDDHIAESLSSLTYGFAWFEVVYKRRAGDTKSPKKNSKYTDGMIGIKKLAIRAPWTVQRFEVDRENGEVIGLHQLVSWSKPPKMIPIEKSIYYRTTSLNNDPTGRSVLRNAYTSYTYLNKIQAYEAIAIERELHGVPVGRMPAEYLSSDATTDQAALRAQFERVLRDVKNNEQGYILLPSDVYVDVDGKPTNQRLMDVELITANGSRSIDIDPVVRRYQHDIARSVMAEFMMLGGGTTGSYALSKTKTDLFLRSMESYINSIVDTLNKQLVEPLWQLNGLPWATMPKLLAGDVAPHDLKELASFLRNLNGADINLADQIDAVGELMHIAELPFNKDEYIKDRAKQKADEEKALTQLKTPKKIFPGAAG